MALDVYVGSLTRYYTGDWESVGETAGRERAPVSAKAPSADRERVQTAVLAWREALAASLGAALPIALDWDEGEEAPWFTARPGWEGFGSLVLWAAYAEHAVLSPPATLPEAWDDDPALARSNAEGFRSRYSHLVRNVELWLPASFAVTFEGEDVDTRRIVVGSAATLLQQLADLNAATWKAGAREIAAWSRRPPAGAASLETGARHAFAVLGDLARRAVDHRLPMKLDF